MKLTDEILNNYSRLVRTKNTWIFRFDVYANKSQFSIEKINDIYIIFVKQHLDGIGQWRDKVLFGTVRDTYDLGRIFLAFTRGERLY